MFRFHHPARRAFISVGAVGNASNFSIFDPFLTVVPFVLSLYCLAKRREALRGRNLPRDSRIEGAPTAYPASGGFLTREALFLPIGHPSHASENPAAKPRSELPKNLVTSYGHRRHQVVALGGFGGNRAAVRRRRSGATRRVNSSLRSLRTRRSQCRRVYSGLKKTLFASVGPNSRCRSHRLRCPASPGRPSQREKLRCQPGRIKPSRGLRLDGMPRGSTAANVTVHLCRSTPVND